MKDIATHSRTQEILKKYGFSFKKSLGQNFLIDANVIKRTLDIASVTKETGIIEVGPGIGSLTEQLAKRAKHVVSYEIDGRLIPILNDTLHAYSNVTIIHTDILDADIHEAINTYFHDCESVIVVANLPYYVTTPILMHFLQGNYPISRLYCMMQKEVGARISASPGSKTYGSLSVAVDYYAEAKIVQHVPRNVFLPPPNVDSIIVELSMRERKRIKIDDEDAFFKLTRGGFVHRRKTLLNNYQTLFNDGKEKKEHIRTLLSCADIDVTRRGESLSIEEYARIYNCYMDQSELELP